MRITTDWHIHSRNSCDSATLTVADLVREAEEKGISAYGLTDHINVWTNIPDIERARAEYEASNPPPHFRFGVEVSSVSQWELDLIAAGTPCPVYGIRSGGPEGASLAIALTDEEKRRLGIEYVVGGCHWPMYVPLEREAVIRDYHRQLLFLARHPLVDIVAHPWWWHGHWQDSDGRYTSEPWFDDFGRIPASLHEEFAAEVVRHGKVVEINISAILLNRRYPERFKEQYLEYLAGLKERSVTFSIGSDCHCPHYAIDFETPARMLERAGFRDSDFWRFPAARGA